MISFFMILTRLQWEKVMPPPTLDLVSTSKSGHHGAKHTVAFNVVCSGTCLDVHFLESLIQYPLISRFPWDAFIVNRLSYFLSRLKTACVPTYLLYRDYYIIHIVTTGIPR